MNFNVVEDNGIRFAGALALSTGRCRCRELALEVRAFALEEVSMYPEDMVLDLQEKILLAKRSSTKHRPRTKKKRSPPER